MSKTHTVKKLSKYLQNFLNQKNVIQLLFCYISINTLTAYNKYFAQIKSLNIIISIPIAV